jgi:superfamily II DNA or RNA helicase
MSDSAYQKFLLTKRIVDSPTGKRCGLDDIENVLFDFQKLLVRWAVKRGRAAIFADCGLGKTLMQLEWARLTGEKCLIVAPLCVAEQTIREASEKFNLQVTYAKNQSESTGAITITNYERIEQHLEIL